MLAVLCAALTLAPAPPVFAATRFEMGERLKMLDVAWLRTTDKERRIEAVQRVSAAVGSFFTGQFGAACRAMDQATAALDGRTPSAADAVNVRFDPPYVEPGQDATLRVTWAYDPGTTDVVEVRAAGESVRLTPGQDATLAIDPVKVSPDLANDPEAGVLVPIQVGDLRRSAYVSVVKNFQTRVAALREAKDAIAKGLGELIESALAGRAEQDAPLIDPLYMAEELERGEKTLADLTQIPFVRQGSSVFRAAFPPELKDRATVVIALHGAGGSENLFFEGYGRGIAVAEAIRRGWVFLAPRSSPRAAQDALTWLRDVRGVTPERVFVIGHSAGGAVTLLSGNLEPKPTAIGLFAPAGSRIPENLATTPTFLAVGKQEMAMLLTSARRIEGQLQGRANSEFREYDPCEHLMIVADAVPDCFAFFDRLGASGGQR